MVQTQGAGRQPARRFQGTPERGRSDLVLTHTESLSFTLSTRTWMNFLELALFEPGSPKRSQGCLQPGNFRRPRYSGIDPALCPGPSESRVLPTSWAQPLPQLQAASQAKGLRVPESLTPSPFSEIGLPGCWHLAAKGGDS